MRWFIDKKFEKSEGIGWIKAFVNKYETDRLEWVRFDPDKAKLVGQCLPPAGDIQYRIACKIPNAYPREAVAHLSPIYQSDDGSWPREVIPAEIMRNEKTGVQWVRQFGKLAILDQDEAIIWAFTRGAFRWLKGTSQIFGKLNEIEADSFATEKIKMFKKEMGISV